MGIVQTLTGDRLNEYTIGPLIGRGGLSDVYEGSDSRGNEVAIKVMRRDYADIEEYRGRFEREIRLMQAVRHPNIVPIVDFGFDQGLYYLVMRRIHGPTLTELMAHHPLTPVQVWHILRDIAPAIHAGHEAGIIHRDLKPGNILVERHGSQATFYLSDFGLSKRPGIDPLLTGKDFCVGTPEYMSPEAANAQPIDPRSDVYSLAVMAYRLLLGVVPFRAGKPVETLLLHIQASPPPMTGYHADFPGELEQVILKGMAKRLDDRHATIIAFARDYHHALNTLPDTAIQRHYYVH
jgi:serine/threonine-protein kinase